MRISGSLEEHSETELEEPFILRMGIWAEHKYKIQFSSLVETSLNFILYSIYPWRPLSWWKFLLEKSKLSIKISFEIHGYYMASFIMLTHLHLFYPH